MYCWQHAERPPHICGTSWPALPAGDGPHRGKVVDLVDPYTTIDPSNQGGPPMVPPAALCHWLDTHPGRWAMTAQNGMGTSDTIMARRGYETGRWERGGRHFARLPHPEGETLKEALHRNKTIFDVLPEVERDPFNWSPAELAAAVQCARDNLFPVSDRKAA
jgi:hypothetical protein